MTVLSAIRDADNWVFVQGMTGPTSVDPLGPAATSAKFTINGGDHYVGAYAKVPSSAILRAFFDAPDSDVDIGYVVTIDAYCFGVRFLDLLYDKPFEGYLPAFEHQKRYVEENRFLDFMGPRDAQLRFINPQAGDRLVDAPLYPFNAFLGSASNNFLDVYWHPLPNGSLRPRTPPPPNSRPSWVPLNASWAKAASLRAVVRPFMIVESDLAEICRPDFAAFDGTVDAANLDNSNLFEAVKSLYETQFKETAPNVVDAKVAGSYLILIASDHSAIIVLRGARTMVNGKAVYPLTIWEVDHDSFERIDHQAAKRTLANMNDWMALRYPNEQIQNIQMQGRGSRPLNRPANLGFMVGRPTFSLDYKATLVGWQPGRTRNKPWSSPLPHSSVSVRFDWVFDPYGEGFDLVVNAPRALPSEPPVVKFWEQYQKMLSAKLDDSDRPDLTPFTLAGAPWLDTAPTAPSGNTWPFPS